MSEPARGTPVVYRLSRGPNAGQYRPATVIRPWDSDSTLLVDVLPDDETPETIYNVVVGTANGTYQLVTGLGGGGTEQPAITSLTDSTGGTANDTLAAITLPATLTDSTGGTRNDVLVAMSSGTTPLHSTAVADLNNNFSELVEEINAGRTALSATRDALADLAAKVNAILVALRAYGVIAD